MAFERKQVVMVELGRTQDADVRQTRSASRTLLAAAIAAIAFCTLGTATEAASQAKDWKTLRIATDGSNPPFSARDSDGVLSGFDVDIAKMLCERLKARCELVAMPRELLVQALLDRKADALVASITITQERRKTIDFTDKYYASRARFVTQRVNGPADIGPDAMQGKRIGATANSPYAAYLGDAYAPKGAAIKLFATDTEALQALRSGQVDALLGDGIRLYRWFQDGSGRCCRFLGPDVRSLKYLDEGAGIAVRKEDGDLRDLLNKALAECLRDGTYEKVNAQTFGFSIY